MEMPCFLFALLSMMVLSKLSTEYPWRGTTSASQVYDLVQHQTRFSRLDSIRVAYPTEVPKVPEIQRKDVIEAKLTCGSF